MHRETLSPEQITLLPLVRKFSAEFGLVGGTALALQLGHRRSVDFDLFTGGTLATDKIRRRIRELSSIDATLVEDGEELTVVVAGVKFTFCVYPYAVEYTQDFDGIIKLPDVLTLAAMKAFALGRRAKWKDYVDLYFVFRTFKIAAVSQKARLLFGGEFNEKLFREQLAYHEDIDYSEAVDFLESRSVSEETIKNTLLEISLEM